MLRSLAISAAVVAAGAALAEPHPLAGVGRLFDGAKHVCSGTLIEPDLVLTAGHCVIGSLKGAGAPGQPVNVTVFGFRPGHSQGAPIPEVTPGATVAIHPIYAFGFGPPSGRMHYDYAVIRLARPVPPEVAQPIPLGAGPSEGEALVIASYRGGAGVVARQRRCPLLTSSEGIAVLGCEVQSGESGAPMLRSDEARTEVAAVVANRGRVGSQWVAFGPVVEGSIKDVRSMLDDWPAAEPSVAKTPSEGGLNTVSDAPR